MKYFVPALLLSLAACQADETLSGYGAADTTWRLTSLDGQPFTARATLQFPAEGSVTGKAPCNSFSGTQTAPYPWFKLGPIRATRAACPELAAEKRFFTALSDMTLAEVSGAVLILSNDTGREMVFRAQSGG